MKRKRRKTHAAKTGSKKSDAGLDGLVDAAVKVLRLKIRTSWRNSVLSDLRVSLRHAQRVADFELPDDAEPAPVFKA